MFSFCLSAWAKVEVYMEDKVEAYLGKPAQIKCNFTSEDGFGGTTIQLLYVSYIKLHAHTHTRAKNNKMSLCM